MKNSIKKNVSKAGQSKSLTNETNNRCPNSNCPWASVPYAEDDKYGCGLLGVLSHRVGDMAVEKRDLVAVQMLLDGAAAISACAGGCPAKAVDVRAIEELIQFDGNGAPPPVAEDGYSVTFSGRYRLFRQEPTKDGRATWVLEDLSSEEVSK